MYECESWRVAYIDNERFLVTKSTMDLQLQHRLSY
jgi:hypothetical protein